MVRKGAIILGGLVATPFILYVSISLLIRATFIFGSMDRKFGQYRTTDGVVATINPYHMGSFFYRDAVGRCIDFWPLRHPTPTNIAAGHGCPEWQRDKTWAATRNPNGSIVLTNQDGQTIGLDRMAVLGRWTYDGLLYDLPTAKSPT